LVIGKRHKKILLITFLFYHTSNFDANINLVADSRWATTTTNGGNFHPIKV